MRRGESDPPAIARHERAGLLKGLQVNLWHYVEGSSPSKKSIGDCGMNVCVELIRIIPEAIYAHNHTRHSI